MLAHPCTCLTRIPDGRLTVPIGPENHHRIIRHELDLPNFTLLEIQSPDSGASCRANAVLAV